MSLQTPGLDLFDGGASLKASSFNAGTLFMDALAVQDLRTFYAYCRAIDDCADEFAPAEALLHLKRWKKELSAMAAGKAGSVLGRHLSELCVRRQIPLSLLEDLWAGAWSDARPRVRFATHAQVRHYAYQVAGAVGLACLPIFGARMDEAGRFALALGEAFQLINVLRDVKEDLGRGRLYLAQEDLRAYGVAEAELVKGAAGPPLERLCYAYAWRARQALAVADSEARRLPRQSLRPALAMRTVYGALLEEMSRDRFQVMKKRYALSPFQKRALLLQALVAR
jgi:phytoene/squalene synthetase